MYGQRLSAISTASDAIGSEVGANDVIVQMWKPQCVGTAEEQFKLEKVSPKVLA